ncbi:MAG: nucleotidyltransferase domain-containing protein [Lachnospiraceae bacterium]|jgi:predicted nucleotidyltransferase|nr:nucleotidyltransferase domain-containing protein [Lachnospiraceae bacterium]
MKETGIKKDVVKEICALAKRNEVEKVILFGSRARGDYGRASDIDLAVCGGNTARFALDVDEETSTPLKYDVVNLDEDVQDDLLQVIAREGKVLYEKI